jgi:hypothetical protein
MVPPDSNPASAALKLGIFEQVLLLLPVGMIMDEGEISLIFFLRFRLIGVGF